jgi:cytochrome P450
VARVYTGRRDRIGEKAIAQFGSTSHPEDNSSRRTRLREHWAWQAGQDALHTPLRQLMNPYLTRAAVARHRPAIENIANGLIDAFIDDGHVDAISQYVNLLAGEVFAMVVGEYRVRTCRRCTGTRTGSSMAPLPRTTRPRGSEWLITVMATCDADVTRAGATGSSVR